MNPNLPPANESAIASNPSSVRPGLGPNQEPTPVVAAGATQLSQIAGVVGQVVLHALLGMVLGMVGTLLHRWWAYGLPVGLMIGLVSCAAFVFTAGVSLGSRWAAAAAAAGWVAVLAVVSLWPPSGSDVVLITNPEQVYYSWVGPTWIYAGALLAAAMVTIPYPRLCRWASDHAEPAVAAPVGSDRIDGSQQTGR